MRKTTWMTSVMASVSLAATLAAGACSDSPDAPSVRVPVSSAIASVQLSPRALIMAPGTTQQLSLTAVALDSTPLTTFDTVRYISTDSLRVNVSSTGLITAPAGLTATTSPVRVIASAVRDGVTRVDTAYVMVVATNGTNPTFTLADPTAATIKVPLNSTRTAAPIVTYFDGTSTVTMKGSAVPIRIQVTPTTLAATSSATQFYTYASSGAVTISATLTVFGTPLSSTYTYNLGNPLSGFVRLYQAGLKVLQGVSTLPAGYQTSTVFTIQPGGSMSYENWVDFGNHTVGVTCTADDGGSAPDPVTGMVSETGSGSMAFPRIGHYTCNWTSDGAIANFPTDGSLHFSVVVQ